MDKYGRAFLNALFLFIAVNAALLLMVWGVPLLSSSITAALVFLGLQLYIKRSFDEVRFMPEWREKVVRKQIAYLEQKLEPDRCQLAGLRSELAELEQKKLYRG